MFLTIVLAVITVPLLGRAPQALVSEHELRVIARSRGSTGPRGGPVVVTLQALTELLTDVAAGPWQPQTERPRGATLENIYRRYAPSVVVIRTGDGHGSGFVIGPQRVLVTNAHVIREGLEVDVSQQASYVHVHTGRLAPSGAIEASPDGARAYVLKVDAERDLALLRLDASREDAATLPLVLAANALAPGADCAIIGHPAAGMLWTIRAGHVTSIGRAPHDLVDAAIARLALGPDRRAGLERQLSSLPSFEMFISSAGANPGDSGGPVLNEAGEVAGVTFAIPADVGERRFTYHVALGELRRFLTAIPTQTMLVVPDPWALGPSLALADLTGDGRPDAIVERRSDRGMRLLVDLDGDAEVPNDDDHFGRLVRGRAWDAEFALHLAGQDSKAFYDSDNDGRFETVLVGDAQSNAARLRFTQANAQWRVATTASPMFSPAEVRNPQLSRQLGRVLSGLAAASSQ